MSSPAEVVAGHLASLPVIGRGPALRAAAAAARAQIAEDETPADRLPAIADRLLRGLHVAPGSAERLEGNRALVAALDQHLQVMRNDEVAAIRAHLEAEADRLHRQAEERWIALAAKIWTKFTAANPGEDRDALRSDIRVCLAWNDRAEYPEVETWQSLHAQLRERHGADILAEAATSFAMPDIHELVDRVTTEPATTSQET